MTKNDLRTAIINNDIKTVTSLLTDKTFEPNEIKKIHSHIVFSSKKGYIEIVKLLLNDQRFDPSEKCNWAIQLASEHGHFEVVELLLKDSRVDPSDWNNTAILKALNSKHLNIIKLLWEDKRVKNTLQKDCLKLYTNLITVDIQNKIENF
jgi:ankyrin repeat protein